MILNIFYFCRNIKKAMDIDPNFTAAIAGLSDVYASASANGSL